MPTLDWDNDESTTAYAEWETQVANHLDAVHNLALDIVDPHESVDGYEAGTDPIAFADAAVADMDPDD